MDRRRRLVLLGVTVLAISIVRRWRSRRSRSRQLGLSAASEETRDPRHTGIAAGALPVDVDARKLPAGWAVAPPVFYRLQRQAVIPLLTPAESQLDVLAGGHSASSNGAVPTTLSGGASPDVAAPHPQAFIVCEGPKPAYAKFSAGHAETEKEAFAKLLLGHPLLGKIANTDSVTVDLLPAEASDSPAQAFTYAVKSLSNSTVFLVGIHGAYLAVAVLLDFPVTSDGKAPASKSTAQGPGTAEEQLEKATRQELSESAKEADGAAAPAPSSTVCSCADAMAAVLAAAYVVPCADESRSTRYTAPVFATTPTGVHQGSYRVSFTQGERTVILSAPPEMVFRSSSSTSQTQGDDIVFSVSSHNWETGENVSVSLTAELLSQVSDRTPSLADAALPLSGSAESTAERALLECIRVTDCHQTNARLSSGDGQGRGIVMYTNAALGAFFTVNEETGIVHDHVLTDTPFVVYYPFGDAQDAPCVTFQLFSHFPATWETAQRGEEDELLHNVRFHFTDWEHEQTDCSAVVLSGLKSVQFTETKDEERCRSYVVPRKDSILVIRFSAPSAGFDAALVQFQSFMDTLHIDK